MNQRRPRQRQTMNVGKDSMAAVNALLLATALAAAASPPPQSPLSSKEALNAFQLDDGLRIELVAAEPLVVDPVAIAFDERGRMYVVENRGYPTGPPEGKPAAGVVALLEDTTGDGRYDKRTEFARDLTFPNGITCWKGGVYVTCAPDVLYLKDTTGDGKADVRKVVFTGFIATTTSQLRVSHPTFALDNWIYLTSGLTSARVRSPEFPEMEPVTLSRTDSRFRPESAVIEPVGGTAQFGQTFDRFGRRFICSNRNHVQHVVLQPRHLRRNPHFAFSQLVEDIPEHGAAARVFPISANITTAAFHAGYFTAACGLFIYEGTALPREYRGNSFVCEPAGNLVHRDALAPAGATFTAKRAHGDREFLASTDDWFRPVNLTSGPDGALYVIDMYRKTIEHPEYLPEATRQITDFESGNDMGRIYRVVGRTSRPPRPARSIGDRTTKQLCADLNHPDAWHRLTAQRLLIERRDENAASILKRRFGDGSPGASSNPARAPSRTLAQHSAPRLSPEGRIHILRALEGLEALDDALVLRALRDSHPAVREHGIQLAQARLPDAPGLLAAVGALADDTDPRVRFKSSLALGSVEGDEVVWALANVALRDADDKWTRAAVLSGLAGRAEAFFAALRMETQPDNEGLVALLKDLGRMLAAGAGPDAVSNLLGRIAGGAEDNLDRRLALLTGFADGLPAKNGTAKEGSVLLNAVVSLPLGARRRVEELFAQSAGIAADREQPLGRRLLAVELLGHRVGTGVPANLLHPAQPSEIQIAAVRALSRGANVATADILLQADRWRGYTQPVREAVMTAVMANPLFVERLLDAVEAEAVSPWSITSNRRNQLLTHRNPTIRERAKKLLDEAQPGDRMKVFERYKSVLKLERDAANGRAVYARHCASCHTFAGEGAAVGPDLTGIRSQPDESILLHIIVPEYEIMPIYATYIVETTDGEVHDGLLAAETPSGITLRRALGQEEVIPRARIASMTASPFSLMPQEMERNMTEQELADLIGFLKGN